MEYVRISKTKKVGDYALSIYKTESRKFVAFANYRPNPLASVWTDELNTIEEAEAIVYSWENTITAHGEKE